MNGGPTPGAGPSNVHIGAVQQVTGDIDRLDALGVDHVFWWMSTEPDQQIHAMQQLLATVRR